MSLSLRVHASLPYSATGHTSIFSDLTLIWVPRVRSFYTVESDHSAELAAPRHARISVLKFTMKISFLLTKMLEI